MKIIIGFKIIFLTITFLTNLSFANMDSEFEKALSYYNKGKFKEAVEILQEYVKHKPDSDAYYRIGYALYKLKKFDEADEYFRQAYLINPDFSPQQSGISKNIKTKKHKTREDK